MEDNIYKKMKEYNPFGPKEGEFKVYQKLSFLKSNLEEITEEQVDEYSVTLGKLFRWLHMAIDMRVQDILGRREKKVKERKLREAAIEKE